jgi:hypothetical protein
MWSLTEEPVADVVTQSDSSIAASVVDFVGPPEASGLMEDHRRPRGRGTADDCQGHAATKQHRRRAQPAANASAATHQRNRGEIPGQYRGRVSEPSRMVMHLVSCAAKCVGRAAHKYAACDCHVRWDSSHGRRS